MRRDRHVFAGQCAAQLAAFTLHCLAAARVEVGLLR
jgi:hypothetical protein